MGARKAQQHSVSHCGGLSLIGDSARTRRGRRALPWQPRTPLPAGRGTR